MSVIVFASPLSFSLCRLCGQNSLGGNSRTCLVVCLSPNEFNAQETLSTLRFGDRTQRIVNVAVSNEVRRVGRVEREGWVRECPLR